MATDRTPHCPNLGIHTCSLLNAERLLCTAESVLTDQFNLMTIHGTILKILFFSETTQAMLLVLLLLFHHVRGLPNFLVLLADDLGFNDVSWNNPGMHTPALEKLAKKGVILDT